MSRAKPASTDVALTEDEPRSPSSQPVAPAMTSAATTRALINTTRSPRAGGASSVSRSPAVSRSAVMVASRARRDAGGRRCGLPQRMAERARVLLEGRLRAGGTDLRRRLRVVAQRGDELLDTRVGRRVEE